MEIWSALPWNSLNNLSEVHYWVLKEQKSLLNMEQRILQVLVISGLAALVKLLSGGRSIKLNPKTPWDKWFVS